MQPVGNHINFSARAHNLFSVSWKGTKYSHITNVHHKFIRIANADKTEIVKKDLGNKINPKDY